MLNAEIHKQLGEKIREARKNLNRILWTLMDQTCGKRPKSRADKIVRGLQHLSEDLCETAIQSQVMKPSEAERVYLDRG